MLLYLILGPFATITHVLLWVLLAYVLRRQRFALWFAVVCGFFTELACVVAIVQALVYVLDGRRWDGGPYPVHGDFASTY